MEINKRGDSTIKTQVSKKHRWVQTESGQIQNLELTKKICSGWERKAYEIVLQKCYQPIIGGIISAQENKMWIGERKLKISEH